MDRRTIAEEKYRQKFEEMGLSKYFEFVRRDWTTDHGRKVFIKCKACDATFLTYSVIEFFKGHQSHVLCPMCGASSDGTRVFTRTEKAKKAAELYAEGWEQLHIANMLGCSISDVGNAAKAYGVVDPARRERGGITANMARMKNYFPIVLDYLSRRGLELVDDWQGNNGTYIIREIGTGKTFERRGKSLRPHLNQSCLYRARKRNNMVDGGITIDALIQRDGCQCYLCGKETNFADKRWGNFGPDYPTIDHVIPLAKGGKHSWDNTKVCCGLCNVSKRDKLMENVV